MKAFVPVVFYAAVTFPMLAGWIEFSGASPDLRPWLYLARLISWLVALAMAAAFFFPLRRRRRLGRAAVLLVSAGAILIQYACFGFLTAHAEERVIRYRTEHRDPHDDVGPSFMYGEFSGSGYSRGAADAAQQTWAGLQWAAVSAFIWFPIIFFASRRLYPCATLQPDTRNT
jgi:hypothetical protein